MIDWGLGLAVGLAVTAASEATILLAMLTPKVPIEKGKTWRGTLWAVSTVSLVIGAIGFYVAGQFGGRGGGGSPSPGASSSAQPTQTATAPDQQKPSTSVPVAPTPSESLVSARVDLYFNRAEGQASAANFQCNVVAYRRQGQEWQPETHPIKEAELVPFLSKIAAKLQEVQREINTVELSTRHVRIYLDPFPGEGVFEEIKKRAEGLGWKVDRLNVPWRVEKPTS